MKKMRLPKPAATRVVNNRLTLGSVYTAKQMRKFAEKAVLLEREACAKVCDAVHARHIAEHGDYLGETYAVECADAIRARG